jgi:hypothetical protein
MRALLHWHSEGDEQVDGLCGHYQPKASLIKDAHGRCRVPLAHFCRVVPGKKTTRDGKNFAMANVKFQR